MAELTKAVLGRVSGRLGDTVFRQRNGKNFVGTRLKKYVPPGDPASVDRRSRFAFTAKLALATYSIPELAAFWEPLTPSGMTTVNYMIQKNILVVNPGSVSDLASIVPEHSFSVACSSVTLWGNTIAAAMAAIGSNTGIDVTKEPNAKLAFVLSLTNPSNETFPPFLFVSGTSETKPLALDAPITFNIDLSAQDTSSVGAYADRKILLALLTLDPAGHPAEYSCTVIKDIALSA